MTAKTHPQPLKPLNVTNNLISLSLLFPLISLQLLLILSCVQLIGAMASITDMTELWAVYSVSQGIQVRYFF